MTDPLRAAAEWLVTIHADDIAIEQGSALWEDLQRLRKALADTARPGLNTEALRETLRRLHVYSHDGWDTEMCLVPDGGDDLDATVEAIAAEYARLTEDRP